VSGSEANDKRRFPPRVPWPSAPAKKVKNQTSLHFWKVNKQQRLRCWSPFFSPFTERDYQRFFFLKSAPFEGRCCRVERPVVQSGQSIAKEISETGRYKDKMAARSMRATLSSRTENWCRPTEFTSLLAGSGDSWLMPSDGRERIIIIKGTTVGKPQTEKDKHVFSELIRC